jgi:UDP-glucose 4-epimerase
MKRVLLTGGSGFIGRNLLEDLAGAYDVAAPRHSELDLLDGDAVEAYLERRQFDAVIHTATHNASRSSKVDLSRVLHNNLRMFLNLARCSARYGRMIYFGSGAEYGRETMPPQVREEDFGKRVPADDYGLSKYICRLAAEQAPNIYTLVVFGCYGPHEDWEIRFISNALCKALHGLPITLRQNVVFDYLYVRDLGRIVRRFLEIGRPAERHYNLCTGEPVDLLTLARTVLELTGCDLEIRVALPGLGREYSGSGSRLLAQLGSFEFTPRRRAIAELAAWYRDRLPEIPRELLLADK